MPDLMYHFCDRDEGWMEYDARGIPLNFVCDICVDVKLAQYRNDVLSNPQYVSDEPIEPEHDDGSYF